MEVVSEGSEFGWSASDLMLSLSSGSSLMTELFGGRLEMGKRL